MKEWILIVLIGIVIAIFAFVVLIKDDCKIDNYENDDKSLAIPNICHFIWFDLKQTEEFLFVYYVAVYSAYIINHPDIIYFYYHYKPFGKWWDKLTQIPNVQLKKVDIPTHIGKKEIKKTAHKADWTRMNVLYNKGGIYLDMDTICVKPWKHLLNDEVVLGKEDDSNICNAIMFTKPKTTFFKIWLDHYEKHFNPNGWGEASISLPYALAKKYPRLLTVKDPDVFLLPSYTETEKIFVKKKDIPSNLISLHLWESFSLKYINDINDWSWAHKNSHTMYGKMLLNVMEKFNIPKVIYMCYKDKSKIPKKVYDNIKKFAPNYKHIVYDDEESRSFLLKHHGKDVLHTYNKLLKTTPAHAADLWRYCILYTYGGVYMDVKMELIEDMDSTIKRMGKTNFSTILSIHENTCMQGFIVSIPNHPILMECIQYATAKATGHDEYFIFTKNMYTNISNYTNINKLDNGTNKNVYLFREKCTKNKEDCYDGLDRHGWCCYVYDNETRIMKTRYADFGKTW